MRGCIGVVNRVRGGVIFPLTSIETDFLFFLWRRHPVGNQIEYRFKPLRHWLHFSGLHYIRYKAQSSVCHQGQQQSQVRHRSLLKTADLLFFMCDTVSKNNNSSSSSVTTVTTTTLWTVCTQWIGQMRVLRWQPCWFQYQLFLGLRSVCTVLLFSGQHLQFLKVVLSFHSFLNSHLRCLQKYNQVLTSYCTCMCYFSQHLDQLFFASSGIYQWYLLFIFLYQVFFSHGSLFPGVGEYYCLCEKVV